MRERAVNRIPGAPKWTQVLIVVAAVVAAAAFVFWPRGGGEPGVANLDLVLAELEARVQDDPQDPEARIAVAIAYLERGMPASAEQQFEQALVLVPESETALVGLGRALIARGKLDEGEAALQQVVDLNADNEMRYSLDQLQGVYYDLAQVSIERGDFEAARDRLDEALKINRTDADTWRVLGSVYVELGDLVEAEAAYKVAVRFVPDYVEVYEALAALYERSGFDGGVHYAEGMLRLADKDSGGAVTRLERAAELAPDMAEAHEGLGIAYELAERPDEALASYRAALQLDPELFLSDLAVQRLSEE